MTPAFLYAGVMRKSVKTYALPQTKVTFECKSCQHQFDSEPDRTEDELSRAHPYRYFANCPICEQEVQQICWQVGLMSACARATGPKTTQGKANSAANLDGHPTPEEAKLTRFNALKHGAYAETAQYFPATPGKYRQCQTCGIDWSYCHKQPACLKKTELHMKHMLAIESGDPTLLNDIHASNQANMSAIFSDLVREIAVDGVAIRNPQGGFDKDGGFHLAKYKDKDGNQITLEEIKANPLIKPMLDILKGNNYSLADMNLTPKVLTDQGVEVGKLEEKAQDKDSVVEYQRQQTDLLLQLSNQIKRATEKVKADPILVEYNQEEQERG